MSGWELDGHLHGFTKVDGEVRCVFKTGRVNFLGVDVVVLLTDMIHHEQDDKGELQ